MNFASCPIEFHKQEPGHNINWANIDKDLKRKIINDYIVQKKPHNPKKLILREPEVHPSHGNCYGRGYTSFLGRSLVSSWSKNY